MFALKTLFVVLSVTVLANLVAGHEPCDYTYYYQYSVRTPERCAAKCASYKGNYGECFAWTMPLSSYRYCVHFYVRYDHSLRYPDGDHCGVNPVPIVNSPSDSDNDEALGPEPAPAGCSVNTYTTDLGYAPTKETCESSCLELKSKRYTACLLWLWDEEDEQCKGITVEDSDYNDCGTPSKMPL